jgi:hypothetical protein
VDDILAAHDPLRFPFADGAEPDDDRVAALTVPLDFTAPWPLALAEAAPIS